MKVRRLKRLNAQQVFLSTLPLNDGGEVSGPNWYFGKRCYDSLRRRYKRMGLWTPLPSEGEMRKEMEE